MKRCRTKEGELTLYYEGTHYRLDAEGLDLPDELAESIRPHVNVIVGDVGAEPVEGAAPRKASVRAKAAAPADESDE